jgi:DNA mismatch repair protein MutH
MNQHQKAEVSRTLYLMTDKTQKEICEVVGWTEKTFTDQKRKGKWDEMKDTKSLTRQQIITILHGQTLKLIEGANEENRLLSAKEIDSIAKLTASIDKLEKKATIETFIEVFEEYNKWLMNVQPDFAQQNNLYQDSFIHSKIVR